MQDQTARGVLKRGNSKVGQSQTFETETSDVTPDKRLPYGCQYKPLDYDPEVMRQAVLDAPGSPHVALRTLAT